jgi:RNA recognition motif. (a.k.a. RRM, RBD, or RNP domain)
MHSGYPPSPQMSAQGMPIPYVPGMPLPRSVSDRSASFDESMLPPSVDSLGHGAGHAGGAAPGTLFAHQQQWGYGASPHDMYGSSSPLAPRPTVPYPGQLGGHLHSRHPPPPHMPPYGGQYFPAASPGPPIQTTASNKGPDGANLFIFHIPNHFTNVDMYQLFYPYGNLLSVRIMVEKDSGRSRGFGFVSYDSPDAAALAIKELNGYAVRMNIVLLWLLHVIFPHFSHLVSVARLAISFFFAVSSDRK